MSYTEEFYDVIKEGCLRSAQTVVPVIMDLLHPETVVDVGCGEGWWLSVFKEHGCQVTGFDGAYVNQDRLAIAPSEFYGVDLATPWWRKSVDALPADLAISLEVAEHLPPDRADGFVGGLCHIADVVLFSAAIPGQGGNGHVNENWPAYWAAKFEARNFRVSGGLRWEFWDADIENWYCQNLLLCVHRNELARRPSLDRLFGTPSMAPISVVHPVLWTSRQ